MKNYVGTCWIRFKMFDKRMSPNYNILTIMKQKVKQKNL